MQLKKKAAVLPRVLALTLALVTVAGMAGYALYAQSINSDSKRIITLGIVGSGESRLIDACTYAVNSADSSRYAVKLEIMTEDEARESLLGGKISGYIIVPDHYARDLYYGKDSRLQYVSMRGASGIGMALINELIGLTAKAGMENTNAIYGAQFYVQDHLPQKNASDEGDRLFERYAALMLTRQETYSVKTVGVAGHSSMLTYLLCGIAIAFLLFWGVSCSPLFRRSGELSCMLSARGLGAAGQISGEAAAYVLLMVLCALPILAVIKAVARFLPVDVAGLASVLSWRAIAAFFLAALMLSLMQFFLYELVRDGITAPLLQFLNAIVQSYVCGCFYPQSFFPDNLRVVASHLPVGVAVRLLGDASASCVAETVLYACGFFAASILLRHRTIKNGEAQ